MSKLSDWDELRELGEGGQSIVTLVRRPERKTEREKSFATVASYSGIGLDRAKAEAFARATYDISRPDNPDELGALKRFKLRPENPDPETSSALRLKNEIETLKQKHEGFLQILDSDETERWIITEYCERGTLDRYLKDFEGNALSSLTAIIPLIETVSYLHEGETRIYHRDIKPQNIFIGSHGQLLLGDFGLVFMPDAPDRPTFSGETVGPRDFMPPWVLGVTRPQITGAFDVYMLAKVLWCMISGRQKLYREDFDRPNCDLTRLFPQNPEMYAINQILRKCLVRDEEDCLATADQLLRLVKATQQKLLRGGQIVRDGVPRLCQVCGEGEYVPELRAMNRQDPVTGLNFNRVVNGMTEGAGKIDVVACACSACGHVQFFKPSENTMRK